MAETVSTNNFQNVHPSYSEGLVDWKRARAVLSGEKAAKKHDAVIDYVNYSNLLIPFSPKMEQQQYNFYRAEAELPGISSQFLKMLMGALLKSAPEVTLPKSVPAEAKEWISNNFGQDSCSFQLFLKDCIEEELTTTRAWVYVDRPYVKDPNNQDAADMAKQRPFPVLWRAEEIINFQEGLDKDGYKIVTRIVIKRKKEVPSATDPFTTVELAVYVSHEIDPLTGYYQVVVYEQATDKSEFTRTVNAEILFHDERLKYIPAWPLNGKLELQTPMLSTFINKEVALYNKISRRNHLLYGAATYTPYIKSDMSGERFKEIVDAGLGSWFQVDVTDGVGVLQTPTEALQDMDRAISASMDEIARLGVRLLTPEVAQSGVALELRNAAQSSQIGFLAELVNILFSKVITFMLNWRYNLDIKEEEVIIKINASLMRQTASVQWAELVTSWYEAKLIPRSLWLSIVKSSELFPGDYDDEQGRKEINEVESNLSADPNSAELDKILNTVKGG